MAQDEKRDPEAGISRRSVLKVAAGGALAGIAATVLSDQTSAAADALQRCQRTTGQRCLISGL